jgi:hypothetical protein
MGRPQILTFTKGQIFGQLKVMKEVYEGKVRKIKTRCTCGNIAIVVPKRLNSGHTKSCGCLTGDKSPVNKGDRFGRLAVIKETYGHTKRTFLLKCDCGIKTEVPLVRLRSGHTQSCGCFRKERQVQANTTHGYSKIPGYYVWAGMINRCYDPKYEAYADYGERDIRVCKQWKNNFPEFKKWLDDAGWYPKCGLEIDRIDNDRGYSPSNCRLSTKSGNNRNKRSNVWVMHKGNKVLLIELWEKYGLVDYVTTQKRVRRGWSLRDSLRLPLQRVQVKTTASAYPPKSQRRA